MFSRFAVPNSAATARLIRFNGPATPFTFKSRSFQSTPLTTRRSVFNTVIATALRSWSGVWSARANKKALFQALRLSHSQSAASATVDPINVQAATAEAQTAVTSTQSDKTRWAYFKERMLMTTEITLTKIFPAGFGWQAAGVLALSQGYTDSSLQFFLATGLGDGLAVGTCHFLYMIGKHAIVKKGNSEWGKKWDEVDLKNEFAVAAWLTSAAFCSGSIWQPMVNFLHTQDLSFYPLSILTGLACGTAFFAGLRAGRVVYPALSGRFANLKDDSSTTLYEDARLSVGIGGAAGAFVGTDYNFVGNPLKNIVGVTAENTAVEGCSKAGLSTALGFAGVQTVQNTTGATLTKVD